MMHPGHRLRRGADHEPPEPWHGFPLLCLLVCGCLFCATAPTQAAENSGRIRLNYTESNRLGGTTSQLFQEYNFASQDQIFGRNRMRLDLRWNRNRNFQISEVADQPSLRMTLSGLAYDFSVLYAPPQYTSPFGKVVGDKLEGLQAIWQLNHDGFPRLRFEYRANRRFQAPFNFTTVSSASRLRIAELDHTIGGFRFDASYRVTNDTSSSATSGDRESRTATARIGFDQAILPTVRVSLSADVQRAEVDQNPAPTLVGRTRNLRGSLMWRAVDKFQLGVNGFYRETLTEGGGNPSLLDVNREYAAKALYMPSEELELSIRHDIRDIRRLVNSSFYDVLRLQAVYAGLLRHGLQARVTAMKHVTIETINSRTPADAGDLTLYFKLYRRTTARASLTYTRQMHRDSGFLSRHGVNKILEIKSQLNRRWLLRLDYRGTQTSQTFEFFEIDSHNFFTHLNYTNTSGFSLSGTIRRSLFVEGVRTSQTTYGLNASGRVGKKFTFALDTVWSKREHPVTGASASSYNARLQYNFNRSAFLSASYQTSATNDITEDKSFTGSFQVTF